MSDLRLYLFGLPRIEYDGRPIKIERRKSMALAAYLACAEHRLSRDTLADLLWPDLDREHGRTSLRSALLALTMPISLDWIEADRTTVALNWGVVWTDLRAFSSLLSARETHGHALTVVCEQCVVLYEQAIALYQSGFMAGFDVPDCADFAAWQMSQREWLRREFADILRQLSVHFAEAHLYDQAIRYARQWLASDPLHEPAHCQLMRLYAANGQRSEALRQYKQCVELLDVELATPPEDETTRLYQTILAGRFPITTSASALAQTASVLPPLPSLIIGRDEALRELKDRLGIGSVGIRSVGIRAVTVIQGWPGVGKSSTVAALAHDQDVMREFRDGILWASLGEVPNILGQLSIWADALHLGEPARASKVEEISAQLISVLRDKRMLLIVDDVWRTEHAAAFRLGGQQGAIVFTTRLNDVAIALAPAAADIYHLPVLSNQAALELLNQLTPETTSQYPDEARELVRDLEGLPLAIHVAGRLLHSEARLGWGVRELLNELRAGDGLLGASAPSDMLGTSTDTTPTIATLLRRSTDLIDAETRLRFAYLGLFVPKPATFDLEAMAVAWNVSDARPTARTLVNRGLLEPVGGGRFQMHSLLVLHARSLQGEGHQI